ncbi:hypothetical protein J31TS6_54810 [Brevibacillus reuszeri]|nr:hypothetical protein J31TS6_54810 [Brevibacillus reuszeri]
MKNRSFVSLNVPLPEVPETTIAFANESPGVDAFTIIPILYMFSFHIDRISEPCPPSKERVDIRLQLAKCAALSPFSLLAKHFLSVQKNHPANIPDGFVLLSSIHFA